MRRCALCLIIILSLCGCGFLRETTYVAVSPHDEDYGISTDSNVMTVTSYLSLKNAMLSMVQEGMDEGEIRAETYSGNLSEDLSQAVYEVTQMTPLGAYGVSAMTYDYSRIVSRYEVHVNIAYKRSREEMQSVSYVTDMNAVREQLRQTLETYSPRLLLQVGDYDPVDLEAEVVEIYLAHPEFALELPEVTMETYPSGGSQRILDIQLTYLHTPEELETARAELAQAIESCARLYNQSNSTLTNLRLLYNRLGRDTALEQVQEDSHSLTNSAYGALLEHRATDYGFAQAYVLLMETCDIPCRLITGQRGGSTHYWCQLQLEDMFFYVDPSLGAENPSAWYFLMDNQDLDIMGYDQWNSGDYPISMLPPILKRNMEST